MLVRPRFHRRSFSSPLTPISSHFSLQDESTSNSPPKFEPPKIRLPKQKHWALEKLNAYSELSKFRLSSLVVLTTGAGFLCSGSPIDLPSLAAACFGTGLCSASAGTLNQMYESDQDGQMNRTKSRPLPSGKVSKSEAALFAASTAIAGTSLLYSLCNPLTAALGAANIFLYAGPYTISKQKSEINTWIGSLVGAIPPVMGWTAAGGDLFSAEPLALGGLLFLWQFPHFFALSWMHREDYGRGGFQMVAVNDPTGARSAGLIFEYSVYLSVLPLLTSAAGLTSYMFAVEGTVINLYLLSLARAFKREQTNAKARKIFLCSLWYLPLLLAAYVFHSKNLLKDKQTLENSEEDKFSQMIADTRETLKGLCMHEILASPSAPDLASLPSALSEEELRKNTQGQNASLCSMLVAEKVVAQSVESGERVIGGAVEGLEEASEKLVIQKQSASLRQTK